MAEQDKPFDLPPDNIVVLGLFNPDILTPPWVQRWVIPEEPFVPGNLETQLPLGRGTAVVTHRLGSVYWQPTRQRLRVWGEPSTTGSFVASVLEQLPHTPVSAVGVNFARLCPISPAIRELSRGFRDHVEPLLGGAYVETSRSDTVLRDDGVQLTLKTVFKAEEPDAVVIDFNYQSTATGDDDRSRSRQLAEHASQAERFRDDVNRIIEELSN